MSETHHAEANRSETIAAPIGAVYASWLDVGSFPGFMPAVRSVTLTSEFYSTWTLSIGGVLRTFDAEITEQLPEERISWRTLTGDVTFEGSVRFSAPTEGSTTVALGIAWTPMTAAERAASLLGADDRAVRTALRRFKDHVEGLDAPAGHSYVTLRSLDADTEHPVPSEPAEESAPPRRRPRHLRHDTD